MPTLSDISIPIVADVSPLLEQLKSDRIIKLLFELHQISPADLASKPDDCHLAHDAIKPYLVAQCVEIERGESGADVIPSAIKVEVKIDEKKLEVARHGYVLDGMGGMVTRNDC